MTELSGEAMLSKNGMNLFVKAKVFFTVETLTLSDKRYSSFNVFKPHQVVIGIIERAVLNPQVLKQMYGVEGFDGKDTFDEGEVMVIETGRESYRIQNIVLMDYITGSTIDNVEFQGVLVKEE